MTVEHMGRAEASETSTDHHAGTWAAQKRSMQDQRYTLRRRYGWGPRGLTTGAGRGLERRC